MDNNRGKNLQKNFKKWLKRIITQINSLRYWVDIIKLNMVYDIIRDIKKSRYLVGDGFFCCPKWQKGRKKEMAKRPYTIDCEDKITAECGIEYRLGHYNDNNEHCYVLNNGIPINHEPTKSDIGTNNLQTNATRTEEEKSAIGSKGGIASGISRQKRKSMKETLDYFLNLRATKADIANLENLDGLDLEHLTKQDVMMLKAIEVANQGSNKHADFVRDTVGERPTQQIDIDAEVVTDADRVLMDKLSKRLEKSQKDIKTD